MSHSYRSLNSIKTALGEVGDAIKKEGVHRHFGPMTFTFTGAGNVSQVSDEDENGEIIKNFNHGPRVYLRCFVLTDLLIHLVMVGSKRDV